MGGRKGESPGLFRRYAGYFGVGGEGGERINNNNLLLGRKERNITNQIHHRGNDGENENILGKEERELHHLLTKKKRSRAIFLTPAALHPLGRKKTKPEKKPPLEEGGWKRKGKKFLTPFLY